MGVGDFIHLLDFPPLFSRDITFVISCLRPLTSSLSGKRFTLKRQELLLQALVISTLNMFL